ncbi:PAS domain S-box protein [bacterium]|nr:PAS domain S-box protein [bacterium]
MRLREDTLGLPESVSAVEAMLTGLGHAVLWLDSELRIVWCNSIAQQEAGGASLFGQHVCALFNYAEHGPEACPVVRALGSGQPVEIERLRQGSEGGSAARWRLTARQPSPSSPGVMVIAEHISSSLAAANQALSTVEDRYLALVQSMGEGLCIVDENERFIVANPAAEKIFGVAAGKLVGLSIETFTSPEEFARITEQTGKRRRGEQGSYRIQIRRPSGELRTVLISAAPSLNKEGLFSGAVALFQDVTEQSQAELALRSSEQRLRLVYNNAPVMLHSIDESGCYVDVNEQWLKVMGYSRGEVIGQPLDTFMTPDMKGPRAFAALAQFWKQGFLNDFRTRFVRSDGSVLNVIVNSVATRDSEGRRISIEAVTDVTERLRAEEELRQSMARYESLVKYMAEGLVISDSEGRYSYANPALGRIYCAPVERIIGKRFEDFLAPGEQAKIEAQRQRRRAGESSTYEIDVMRFDGERRTLQVTGTPRFDDEGAYLGAIGLVQDITERMSSERALRDSERRYRELVQSLGEGVQVMASDGRILYANPAAERLLGLEPGEAAGRFFSEYLHPASMVNYQRLRQHSGGVPMNAELQIIQPGGSVRLVQITLTAGLGGPGAGDSSVMVLLDITEMSQAQRETRRLAAAIEQSAESIVILDTNGVIDYANPAFERSSGYQRREAVGQHLHTLLYPGDSNELLADMEAAMHAGEAWHGRVKSRRRDGIMREEDVSISPVRDDSGRIVSYVSARRDITDEVSLHEQLRQAQKMEAVGHMAGGLAHEFNNLLTAIIGNLSMAESVNTQAGLMAACLNDATAAAQRCADLTKQILMFSRKTAGTFSPCSLNDLLRGAAKLAKPMFDPDQELILELDSDPAIMGDTTLLNQVAMNLIINARDATRSSGGRIQVRSGVQPGQAQDGQPGGFAYFMVEDNGVGMSDETIERIFEPFFTTKPSGKGTGLGLAVVYGIIKQHGGRIAVDSIVGRGSRFTVYLPLTDQKPEIQVVHERAVTGGSECIMVVEDEPVVVHLLEEMLKAHGYKVLVAQDGLAALDLYRRHCEEVDLLILDVVLPGMSGVEIWRCLQREYPGLNVLFSSGHAPDDEMMAISEEGGPAFIGKPYRAGELLKAVREALARRPARPVGA